MFDFLLQMPSLTQQQMKWNVQFCLRLPPSAHPHIATVGGVPFIIHKSRILFYVSIMFICNQNFKPRCSPNGSKKGIWSNRNWDRKTKVVGMVRLCEVRLCYRPNAFIFFFTCINILIHSNRNNFLGGKWMINNQ